MNKIFAIVVIYNGLKWIDKCFESLLRSDLDLNILAIDNASEDNSIHKIKESYPEVKVIMNKENKGFGFANNQGIKIAMEYNCNYIFLLNQDAWIEPDTITSLIKTHKNKVTYGIISPIHLNGYGDNLDKNFQKCMPIKSLDEICEYNRSYDSLLQTHFVNAACWLLSRETILKIGGFDPIFTHYGEDRDYCNRAKYFNIGVGVDLNSFIYHDRNYEINNPFRKIKRSLYSSGLAFLKNVNRSLVMNYSFWIISRIKKIIKYAIKFQWGMIVVEVNIIYNLFLQRKQISEARNICMNANSPFIE